jgi:hypothetical protein
MNAIVEIGASRRVSLIRDKRGTSVVEAAVVFPFLLIIGMGIIEFGFVIAQVQSIQVGLKDAARFLAQIDPDQSGQVIPGGNQSYEEFARNQVAASGGSLLRNMSSWGTDDVRVVRRSIANCAAPIGGCEPDKPALLNGFSTIHIVRMETEFSPPGIGLLKIFGLTSLRVPLSHEERVVNG